MEVSLEIIATYQLEQQLMEKKLERALCRSKSVKRKSKNKKFVYKNGKDN